MAIQFPRGNTSKNNSHTGADGAISIDFEGEEIIVHDGTTSGGAFSVGKSSEGTGSADLSVNYATGSLTITNSGGNNATLESATTSDAGVMSSSDKDKLDGVEASATSNSSDSDLRDRSSHTGTQSASTISDFDSNVIAAVESGNIDFGEL